MPNFECKASGDHVEMMIYGPIATDYFGDGSVVDPRAVAKSLTENKGAKSITLRVNSPGGNAFHAFAIYESLKNSGAKIKAQIDGIAASAASLIIMAADEIVMNSAGLMMIHRASVGAYGTAEDLRQTAEIGDKIDQSQAKVFVARTGLPESEVVAMLYAETWMTAEEALAKKFISAISPAKTVAAQFGEACFTNVPERVRPLLATLQLPAPKGKENMATEAPKPADTPAKVETPAVVAPVASAPAVDVEKLKADAKAEAQAEERKRAADINALCQQAKKPQLAAEFIEKGESVADVQSKLFKAMCEGQQPDAHVPDEQVPAPQGDKENAKFVAEYKAAPAYAKAGMSQEDYVAMRRVDEGLDVLKTAEPKK